MWWVSNNVTKPADTFAYPPRAMRLERAAAYLSMSPSAFLRLVDDGLMPKPVKIRGVTAWDRLELDSAFDSFKDPDQNFNTMHQLLGIGGHDEAEIPLQ